MAYSTAYGSQIKSKLSGSPNYQYNISVNGVCLCPENLSELGGLSGLSMLELTDLYCIAF